MKRMAVLKVELPKDSERDLRKRFEDFLADCRKQRFVREGRGPIPDPAGTETGRASDDAHDLIKDDAPDDLPARCPADWQCAEVHLTSDERRRIQRRVGLILARRREASGVSHLKPEEIARLSGLAGGVRLVLIRSEAQADGIAAGLHAEMPWMGAATQDLWQALRRAGHTDGVNRDRNFSARAWPTLTTFTWKTTPADRCSGRSSENCRTAQRAGRHHKRACRCGHPL